MRRRASPPVKLCPRHTDLLQSVCPGNVHCAACGVSVFPEDPVFPRQTSDKAKCPASSQSSCLRGPRPNGLRRRSNGTGGPATGGPATGGPGTGGLQQPHPPASAPGGSASAAGPNRGLTRRALAASALTELTTSFSAPPSWFSMFKPLSSSATQRAHTSCPSSSNLNVWNLHIQCICVAPRRNGIAEAASTQRLTTAKVWNYSLKETSAQTICPHDGGEVMVKYRDPHSPPVQKQTTHWERANTHLGNKHDKNWKQGANAHLSEMFGILVIMQ